jgi:ABC-type phosphate transport system substrate-binding protein
MSEITKDASRIKLPKFGRRAIAILVAMVAMVGLAGPATATLPPFTDGKVSPFIRSAGSDTTYDAMQRMDALYNAAPGCTLAVPPVTPQMQCSPLDQPAPVVRTENYDHEVAVSMYPQGSGAGLRMLCQKNDSGVSGVFDINFARSSSGPGSVPAECQNAGDPLRYVAWAKDAIAIPKWLGGASAGVTSLTHDQLREIFLDVSGNGCTEDWGNYGGTAGQKIIVNGIQTSSGTYAAFQAFLGGDPNTCVPGSGGKVLFENDCTPINNLPAADKGRSIWWLSFGKYSTGDASCGATDTGLISVNGVAPSKTTIQDGTYQYNRSLYNVYRRNLPAATPWALGYMGENGWICKPNGLHSKPVGDTGPGVENAGVDRNWGQAIDSVIAKSGFVNVNANPNANKCLTTDVN